MTRIVLRIVLAVAFFALLRLSVPGLAIADGQGDRTSSLLFHGEVPPASKLAFSVANVAPKSGAPCDKIEAVLRIVGTSTPTTGPRTGVETLEVLHLGLLELSPGEVQAFEFLQASSAKETVILQLVTSNRGIRCLTPSSISVLNAAGDLVSVAPTSQSGGVRYIDDALGGGVKGPSCCACAPICGCGVCD